ncbi:hypothetical protein PTKIN_Ptkin19aG0073700 [Pterospermum kingtungense]
MNRQGEYFRSNSGGNHQSRSSGHGESSVERDAHVWVDWRANLHTVWVNNLSRRVSKGSLWEAFNGYGRVVDVFINYHSRKPYTYAFVRYIYEEECRRAVQEGNRRRIDGRLISIKIAAFGWKERRIEGVVLLGSGKVATEIVGSCEKINGDCIEEVSFNVNISDKEMEWLQSCVFGRLKCSEGVGEVRKMLLDNGYSCQVCPLGGFSLCIIFNSLEDRLSFLDKSGVIASPLLDDIGLWNDSWRQRKSNVWVILKGVPLQLWNANFFESLANRWGSFICLDENTLHRRKLDEARILVNVESKLKIPSRVSVQIRGRTHKIIISIDEDAKIKLDDDNNGVCEPGVNHEVVSVSNIRCNTNSHLEACVWDGEPLFNTFDKVEHSEFSSRLRGESNRNSWALKPMEVLGLQVGPNLLNGYCEEDYRSTGVNDMSDMEDGDYWCLKAGRSKRKKKGKRAKKKDLSRKFRSSNKETLDLVRVEDNFIDGVMDYSISEEDIRHRNEVILRELRDFD